MNPASYTMNLKYSKIGPDFGCHWIRVCLNAPRTSGSDDGQASLDCHGPSAIPSTETST